MSLLVTMPGRFGDILWSLPTVRTLSARAGAPVDLAIAGEFASILPLLNLQPYIRRAFALDAWSLTPPEEWRAPIGELKGTDWDEQRDLGYRGWPDEPLPYYIGTQMGVEREELDLGRPWVQVPKPDWRWSLDIAFGFSECWFELKYGLIELLLAEDDSESGDGFRGSLTKQGRRSLGLFPSSRWTSEAGYRAAKGWVESAQYIQHGRIFFGDCSALHVLAVACGRPVLIMEPMIARHNSIFYPFGMDGPQVTVVKGHDGLPTFDARAVQAAIEQKLEKR